MLTLKLITEEKDRVVRGLEKKHFPNAAAAVEEVLSVDKARRQAQAELDTNLSKAKKMAAEIAGLMRQGKRQEADEVKAKVAQLKQSSLQLEDTKSRAEAKLVTLLCAIPNIPYDIVPEGTGAEDNWVVKSSLKECVEGKDTVGNWDANPVVESARLPHWELARKYNLIDFDLGVKITGAGFPVYRGQGARLQRALINFFLDDLYLIPTAEVPVTNIYRDLILEEKDLPIKNCAYTQCFRREAGSYGKNVRGLNRLHEFSKIEIVRIDTPEHSDVSHKEMLAHVEGLLKKLELPYRILRLCGGDMSFTSSICYDFEVYSEAQKRWLEVSSVSNFDTYQANRLKCRVRRADDKKTVLAHTLNGSALALPRIVAALLENNQTAEGIRIPKALVPYMGCDMIK